MNERMLRHLSLVAPVKKVLCSGKLYLVLRVLRI